MVVGAFNNNIKCHEFFNVLSFTIYFLKMIFNSTVNLQYKKNTVLEKFLVSSMSPHIKLFYLRELLIKFELVFACSLHFILSFPPTFLNVARY